MIKRMITGAVALFLSGAVQAANITFPDLSNGGSFTLNAGDETTNTGKANIADQAAAVLTINGEWHHGGHEVQLGGVNYHATQDVTLNIGSSGSATWGQTWIGDGVPYGGTVVINIAAGGRIINDGSGSFGTNPHASDGNSSASWSDLWEVGMLKRDGLGKVDLTPGMNSFGSNFTLVGSIGGAHTLTAIVPSKHTFLHPGIPVTIADLNAIKANLKVEPWKTGYDDMASSSTASLDYEMQGPFAEVGRRTNNGQWSTDMKAVHNMARMWYFTGEEAYAQKARDILIAWATTHTLWNNESGTYLTMGYECMHIFVGADILRGAWPGWTDEDTETCKAYFEDVWWDEYHIAVPNPLKSANQGASQFTAALGVAVFNDDEEKFNQCLEVFLTDAPAALGNTLPNGQIGDTGRDAHDQGQLMLLVWAAEVFWKQGIDVYSVLDNRLLAGAEYLSRFNLFVDTPFIQHGTVYDIYPKIHSLDGEYANWGIESKMLSLLYQAYIVRKGMCSPYLEQYFPMANHSLDTFCYLNPDDISTATLPGPVTQPADVASVTSLSSSKVGDCAKGKATYQARTGTWTVSGRGTRLSESSGDYYFAYLPVSGDATIIAQVTSLSGDDSEARAGVVFAETLSGSSEMQAMVLTNPSGDNKLWAIRRGAAVASGAPNGGSSSHRFHQMPPPDGQYWVKIERIGNRINSYSSPDGASWACGESADYDWGSTAYIGLAVSSADNSDTATATFKNVRMTGGDGREASKVPPAPYIIMASPGGDRIPVRWLESFEATSYKLWRTITPGGFYTLINQQTGTSFVDTNVVSGTRYYYAVNAVNAAGEGPPSTESTFEYADTDFYEAEDYAEKSGVRTENTGDFFGGKNLSRIGDGNWCRYDQIQIGEGAIFKARCAGYGDPIGYIEVRLNGIDGTLVGILNPIDTGGAQTWATAETTLSAAATGTHDLCLVFKAQTPGGSPGFNLNWFDIEDLGEFSANGDIGVAAIQGTATYKDGVYTVEGGGAGIYGTRDSFHSVYKNHTGDGELSARVESVENVDTWSKAGVMFRESLKSNAKEVCVCVRSDRQVVMLWRTRRGGKTNFSGFKGDTTSIKWVKLVRVGNVFTGYYSTDGSTWVTIASQTVAMSPAAEVGLAVTSHVDGTLCTTCISEVVFK